MPGTSVIPMDSVSIVCWAANTGGAAAREAINVTAVRLLVRVPARMGFAPLRGSRRHPARTKRSGPGPSGASGRDTARFASIRYILSHCVWRSCNHRPTVDFVTVSINVICVSARALHFRRTDRIPRPGQQVDRGTGGV